jgi:hypothetical protein
MVRINNSHEKNVPGMISPNSYLFNCFLWEYRFIYEFLFTSVFSGTPMGRTKRATCIFSKNYTYLYSLITAKFIFMFCLFVFPGVTTHCGCIFHSPVAGFSLLVFEVS